MESSNWFESTYPEEVYDFPAQTSIVLGVPFSSLKEAELELLSKILQAVRLSLAAVRIVEEPHLDLSSWTNKPGHIIAFQSPPKGIELNSVIQTQGTSIIFSHPLSELAADLPSKQKLWAALKFMFTSLRAHA